MSLSCERSGKGPNGPLNEKEQAVYQRWAWKPEDSERACDRVYAGGHFATTAGRRSYADYLDPHQPMDIDSPYRHATSPPRQSDLDDSDIVMADAPSKRSVAWTPPHGFNLSAVPAFPCSNKRVRRSAIKTTHQPRHVSDAIPKTPYPMNPDVDYSVCSFDSPPANHTRWSPLALTGRAKEVWDQGAESQRRMNEEAIQNKPSNSTLIYPELSPSTSLLNNNAQEVNSLLGASPKPSPEGRKIIAATSARRSSSLHTVSAKQPWSPPHHVLTPTTRRGAPFASSSTRTPSTADLTPSLRNTHGVKRRFSEVDAPEHESPKNGLKFGGMFVNIITGYIPALFGRVWRWLSIPGQQQIVAVPASAEMTKRRAIAKEDMGDDTDTTTTESSIGDGNPGANTCQPEAVNNTDQTNSLTTQKHTETVMPLSRSTPPDSRPSTSEEPAHQESSEDPSAVHGNASRPSTRGMPLTYPMPYDSNMQRKALGTPIWCRGKPNNPHPIPKMPPQILAMRMADQDVEHRKKQEQEREQRVNEMIKKTKDIVIETEKEKSAKASISTRKRRVLEEEYAKHKAEQDRIAAQEALEAAREAEAKEAEEKKKAEELALALAQKAASRPPLPPPLSSDWEQQIVSRLAGRKHDHAVAKTAAKGTVISRYDIGCILPQPNEDEIQRGRRGTEPSNWLNDEIVNAWMEALVAWRCEQEGINLKDRTLPKTPPMANYNCAWWPTYRRNNDMKPVGRWSRKMGISGSRVLECELVLFPLNPGHHWILLAIRPKDRTIMLLDSLHGRTAQYMDIAREWLQMELGDLYVEEEWEELETRSERQLNMSDCGVFTCMNALAAATGRSFSELAITSGMRDARKYMTAVILNGGFKGEFAL